MTAWNTLERSPKQFGLLMALGALATAPAALAQPYVPESSVGQPNGVAGLDSNIGTTFGSTTLDPTVNIIGPANSVRGLVWKAPDGTRLSLVTDTADNLNVYTYDDNANYLANPISIGRLAGTVNLNGFLTVTSSAALAQGQGAISLSATNTSAADDAGSFDTGQQSIALFNPTTFLPSTVTGSPGAIAGPGLYEGFRVALSPIDQTHNWGTAIEEWDIINRGRDMGWFTDRGENNGQQPVTGGMVIVAFQSAESLGQQGSGSDVLYGYSAARSPTPNSLGYPIKFYNDFLCEPDSETGVGESTNGVRQSYCLYGTGDLSGVAAQVPYAPAGWGGTWLHGMDFTAATFQDGLAVRLAGTGQAYGFYNGTSTASIAGSTALGVANEGIVLTPAGIGAVQIAGRFEVGSQTTGSPVFNLNAGSAQPAVTSYLQGGIARFGAGIDASGKYQFYAYSTAGAYIGNPFTVLPSLGAGISVNGHVANTGAAPTLSSCGTSPTLSATASDRHGTVTPGSGATSCTITFQVVYVSTPDAQLTGWAAGTIPYVSAVSTTALTVGFGAVGKFTYSLEQ